MKILLIDDSKVIYLIVSAIFEESGYELKWAQNGKLGMDLLNADEKFDIILLDWNMPVMDGPTFLLEFKNKKISDMPIMMLTTENSPAYIERALNLGVAEYVMKPFTGDILLSKIQMIVESRKAS
ncbi:MAG: response regulator transcription factor [Pseudobdellovibrio sp.]